MGELKFLNIATASESAISSGFIFQISMEEALLHGACRYSGTKVTNRNKIAVGSGDFSFGEKNCVFLSAISGTISAKSLCFVFKGKVLRD